MLTAETPDIDNLDTLITRVSAMQTELQKAAMQKVDEHSKGHGTHRRNNWFKLVEQTGPELLEDPTLEKYERLSSHVDTEWTPHLVHTAVVQRRQLTPKAFREALETGFQIRHKLETQFGETLPTEERDQMLVHGFVRQHTLMSEASLNKMRGFSTRERYLVCNLCLGTAVEYGKEHPERLEEVFAQINGGNKAMRAKMSRYAKDRATNQREEQGKRYFRNTWEDAVTAHERETEGTMIGIRGEILTTRMLEEIVAKIPDMHVGRLDPEIDIRGIADMCIYRDSPDGPQIVLLIETKVENREDVGILLVHKDRPAEGSSDLAKAPPKNMLKYVAETGESVMSLRIPRHWAEQSLMRSEDSAKQAAHTLAGQILRTKENNA